MDFSLPEAPNQRRTSALSILTFLVTVACLVFILMQRSGPDGSRSGGGGTPGANLDSSTLQEVAEELERRTLYREAALAWEDYARTSSLDSVEAAAVVFRRARNFKEAGDYAAAARLFTLYEKLGVDRDQRRKAATLLLDCLSSLGKEDAREHVLDQYTLTGEQKKEGTVVARVGGDAITMEKLRKNLSQDTRALLRSQGALFPPEQEKAQVEQIVEKQLGDKKIVQQILQQALQLEVLSREGMARGYGNDSEYRDALQRFRASYLASRVLQNSLGQVLAGITEQELRNHYGANKEEFIEKPGVEFSYREFATEEGARAALDKIDGSAFVKGSAPAVQGEAIPGLGRSAEATAHLLALSEGETGSRPLRLAGSWYIFRADKKREKRQRSFEEAQPDVQRDYALIKQREAAEKLQAELSLKFRIQVLEDELNSSLETEKPSDVDSDTSGGSGSGSGGSGTNGNASAPDSAGKNSSASGTKGEH